MKIPNPFHILYLSVPYGTQSELPLSSIQHSPTGLSNGYIVCEIVGHLENLRAHTLWINLFGSTPVHVWSVDEIWCWTALPPSTSVFFSHYLSINAPSPLSSYQKDQPAKPEDLQTKTNKQKKNQKNKKKLFQTSGSIGRKNTFTLLSQSLDI